MAQTNGLLSRIVGGQRESGCCAVTIVPEDEQAHTEQATTAADSTSEAANQ